MEKICHLDSFQNFRCLMDFVVQFSICFSYLPEHSSMIFLFINFPTLYPIPLYKFSPVNSRLISEQNYNVHFPNLVSPKPWLLIISLKLTYP